MLKKLVKGIILGGTLLGLMAGGVAADVDINLYGASAQHTFWSGLAKPFLEQYCDSAANYDFGDKKNAMTVGTNCTINGTSGQNVYFRYSSRASYDGINAVKGTPSYNRSMCSAPTCAQLTSQRVHLGASDVAAESFTQSTTGYEDGNQDDQTSVYTCPGTCGALPPDATGLEQFQPIVVPFGFYVSSCVKEYRCTAPAPGEDKAYDRFGTSCVPETPGSNGPSNDCIGYFQCLGYEDNSSCSLPAYDNEEDCTTNSGVWTEDITSGTCNGGLNVGNDCEKAENCPDVDLESTKCTARPLDNITQNMARQIFADALNVDQWTDFGPEYENVTTGTCAGNDGYIRLCMRHAGSGTHATFDLAVMDGQTMRGTSFPGYDYWHFTSSSDLAKCVTDLPGAIGYADVDKLIGFKQIGPVPGAHIVKYNGAYPSQRNIVNGIYEFWAAQHIYYESGDLTADQEWLRSRMDTYSSQQANINAIGKGDYWAAQGAMLVERLEDGGIITRKP